MTFKEKRTEQILCAAYQVFVEKGFEWTTMQDIADKAGLGVATVFRYFPKKNKLIIAVIVQLLKEKLPSFERIQQAEGSCYEKIEMLMDHYVGVAESHVQNDMKLLEAFETYAAYVKEPMEDIEEYHQAYADITNIIASIIEEGKEDGSIRSDMANRDVLGAISNVMGIFVRKLSFFESVRMGEMVILPVEQAIIVKKIFLDYLKPSTVRGERK